MSIEIGIYIRTPILNLWLKDFTSKMNGFVECQYFSTVSSLTNNLKNFDDKKLSNYFIIFDVEDELHAEYVINLKKIAQNSKFIAFGLPKNTDEVKKFLKAGFNGYLDISISNTEFINAINCLKDYRFYLPNDKIDDLINSLINEDNSQKDLQKINYPILKEKLIQFELTDKEIEVIDYLIKGFSFKQVSQIIGVSSFAVNQRTKSVYKKCNVKSRSELSYLLLK